MAEKKFKDQSGSASDENAGLKTGSKYPKAEEFTDPNATPAEVGTADGNTSVKTEETLKINEKVLVSPVSEVTMDPKSKSGSSSSVAALQADGAGSINTSSADDVSRSARSSSGNQPDSLHGKRISEQYVEIDQTKSEFLHPVVDEALAMQNDANGLQSYRGRAVHTQERGKKNYGDKPQDLLFFRSADFLDHDEILYTDGQVLDNVAPTADYPTITASVTAGKVESGVSAEYYNLDKPMRKSNYMLESFNFTIANGHISKVWFGETQFKVPVSYKEKDIANLNWQIDANNVTKAWNVMRDELGKEAGDSWSPLGYAIPQGHEYMTLLHDIELVTGSVVSLAWRAANSSLAQQLNMCAKDGANRITPAVRSFLSGIGELSESEIVKSVGLGRFIDKTNASNINKVGSASAIINSRDSMSKYDGKASFLLQPKALRAGMPAARNFISNFKVKEKFINALANVHTYSTITGEYNPALPIYRTNWIHIVNPLSLNFFLQGWSNPLTTTVPDDGYGYRIKETGTRAIISYKYEDMRTSVVRAVTNPLVDGICKWLLDHEAGLVRAYGNSATVSMPAGFNMSNPTMFQMMIIDAMKDINDRRKETMTDLFEAEIMTSNFKWSDLISVGECNPLKSSQLSINGWDSPIKLGKLSKAMRLRMTWPEHFSAHAEQTGEGINLICPWYMNETSFATDGYQDNNSFLAEDNGQTMTIPSVIHGVNHLHISTMHELPGDQVRLCMDRMVTVPTYTSFTKTGENYVPYGGVYTADYSTADDDIHINALKYDAYSQGRVIVTYDKTLPYAALMCVPRELGFIAPGLACMKPVITAVSNNSITFDTSGKSAVYDETSKVLTIPYDAAFDGSSAWALRSFRAPIDSSTIDNATIVPGSATEQEMYSFYSARFGHYHVANSNFVTKIGYAPTISALFETGKTNLNVSISNVTGIYGLGLDHGSMKGASGTTDVSIMTMARGLYGIIQRVFFASNPFDNALISSDEADAKAGVYIDPLEASFYFGVSGTLASDYSPDVINRWNKYIQLGDKYQEDVYTSRSLILQDC